MFQIAQLKFYKWTTAAFIQAIIFLLAPFYYHNNYRSNRFKYSEQYNCLGSSNKFRMVSVNRVLQKPEIVLSRKAILVLAFPILATVSGFISSISAPIERVFRLLFIWRGLCF